MHQAARDPRLGSRRWLAIEHPDSVFDAPGVFPFVVFVTVPAAPPVVPVAVPVAGPVVDGVGVPPPAPPDPLPVGPPVPPVPRRPPMPPADVMEPPAPELPPDPAKPVVLLASHGHPSDASPASRA
jgi:hypothetical protein